MPDNQAWIPTRVGRAGEGYTLLTECVANRLEDLLRGSLVERQLTKAELATIAKELLAGMAPAPSEGQGVE